MNYEEFQQALRHATEGVAGVGSAGRDSRIADLRHALRDRVAHAEFDGYVRRLRDDGLVALTAHARPNLLDDLARRNCIADGPCILYFLRWLS